LEKPIGYKRGMGIVIGDSIISEETWDNRTIMYFIINYLKVINQSKKKLNKKEKNNKPQKCSQAIEKSKK